MQENYLPNNDFFDFEVYHLPNAKEADYLQKIEKPIVVWLKNASEDELALLAKIFQAVGKNMEQDACIINEENLPLYKNITANPHVKKVLFFGVNPHEIGLLMQVKGYMIIPFQGKDLLFSHSLKVIGQDVDKKKQLWGQLQGMFKS